MATLNSRLEKIDFDFESGNMPPPPELDYLKKNGRVKMSPAESLCFCRYFGLIIREKIPEDDDVWQIYT